MNVETQRINNQNYEGRIDTNTEFRTITVKSLKTNFKVITFDDHCEEYSRIKEIVSLKKSNCKIALFVLLNIITACLIDVFIIWFPSMQLYLIYSKCVLKEAEYVGIYGNDNTFYVVPLNRIKLLPIDDYPLRKYCSMNIEDSSLVFMFTFKLFKYIFSTHAEAFQSFEFDIKLNHDVLLDNLCDGLNEDEVAHQKVLFGICDLNVHIPSIFKLLFIEFSDPFYVFQVFSVILWYFNEYFYYASIIIVATIISLAVSVYENYSSLLSIQGMARYVCKVNVYRRKKSDGNGTKAVPQQMRSTELVPGDLFEIPDDGFALPCDCILISGTVIVNESMLTGESTPIIKNQMHSNNMLFNSSINSKHVIFAGTKIVQKRALNNQKVLAIVYRTGFETVKGNLIRSILFPKELEKRFKADSFKYIIVMAVLSLIGFLISLPFLLTNAGLTDTEIAIKFLDLITTTVPPALPTCLGVGVSYAVSRLSLQKIICINRERVNIVGKINTIVFDKTGTLTEDHLDISGYRPITIRGNSFVFDDFQLNVDGYMKEAFDYYKGELKGKNKILDLKQLFIECLASCHGITTVKAKLIGDPIDVKMFQESGWIIKDNVENTISNNNDLLVLAYVRPKFETDLQLKLNEMNKDEEEEDIIKADYELGIIKRFDFSSSLQRMTTIVKDKNDNFFKIFCKGSPEKVCQLCKPETIPSNFQELLAGYTSKGLRVLAFSTKLIKMDFTQSQNVLQSFVEKNMIFLGLLIVQNKLKKATPASIELLDNSNLQMVMATGDNILTSISVSKECKLIPKEAQIYTCELIQEKGENEENKDSNVNSLIWQPISDLGEDQDSKMKRSHQSKLMLNDNIALRGLYDSFPPELIIDQSPQQTTMNEIGNYDEGKSIHEDNSNQSSISQVINIEQNTPFNSSNANCVLAITGSTFEALLKKKIKYIKTKNSKYKPHYDAFMLILRNCYIYARMAPEHKTLLVENMREESLNVMMCGDGANDCGALRAADVGVSLSPEEASIAAHFTSKVPDISCLITLLREGKASLVTSIQTFKYMMMYSFIQFFSVTFLMIYQSYLSDPQFLVSDIFIIFPLAFFIAQTDSYPHLTKDIPESSLLSLPILSSIIIHMCITLLIQLGSLQILKSTYWYINTCEVTVHDTFACTDNSTIFLVSNMQYLISAISFSMSKPYRKPIYTNYWLLGYLFVAFFISIYIIVAPAGWTKSLLILSDFEDENFKYYILLITILNFCLCYLVEKLLIPCIEKHWNNYNLKKLKHKLMLKPNDIHSLSDYQKVHMYNKSLKNKKN